MLACQRQVDDAQQARRLAEERLSAAQRLHANELAQVKQHRDQELESLHTRVQHVVGHKDARIAHLEGLVEGLRREVDAQGRALLQDPE
jgi:hypothetical protein